MAKVTRLTAVFPDTGLPQIPTQSNNSDNELKQTIFHTENARKLSVFCGHGKANLLLCAVRVLCRNAP